LAYQPPASSTFLSEQTSHQQPVSSTFPSEEISIRLAGGWWLMAERKVLLAGC
jgi:hypothetical protein